MAIRRIQTANAPSPGGPYSQAIVVGDVMFTAGFGPADPIDGSIPEGIEAQTRQVLSSLGEVLSAGGFGFADVVKVTAHLQALDRDFEGYNRVYREFFAEPFPARTTVGSNLAGILVEIDVVAIRGSAGHESSPGLGGC